MELSNLEIRRVVEELASLEGKYFEKMTMLGQNTFMLKVRGINVLIKVPETVHVTYYQYDSKHATGFMMFVRKQLRNKKIVKIEQGELDRVIVFHLDNGWRIVVELFGTGNVVIVNEEGNTRYALYYDKWKDRLILPNKPYTLPASAKLNPFEMDVEQFKNIFGKKDIIRSLVGGINMSGKYLEEACAIAGVDKNANDADFDALFKAVKKVVNHEAEPGNQGEPVLFKLKSRSEKFEKSGSFMESLDDFFADVAPRTEDTKEKFTPVERMEHRLKEQMDAMLSLERKQKDYKAKAEWLYENINLLRGVIAKIKEERQAGRSWKEINGLLAPNARVDPKTKLLTVKM